MTHHIYRDEEILQFIPQRSPIIMVDTLYETDGEYAITALHVKDNNIFVENGSMLEAGLIEHIAQSASVMAGYKSVIAGNTYPIGYIGEIKRCQISKKPHTGEELITHISTVSEINGIILIKAETKSNYETVISCQMKIFIEQDNA